MPPARNEPCSCGSGRKYKHCCGKASAERVTPPGDAQAHYLRGQALEEQGLLERAAESFGRATALNPEFADAHNDLGEVLLRLGRTDAAIASCRRALALRPRFAAALGNLKQLFARGQEFTYSIEDIARYYRTYLELMEHWDTVLPGRVLRVHHEDVVDDLERSVRRILDFCELPFEPACVEFHRTERSVRTASSEQVRRPIFREGLDQWRRFETWLGPLRDTLGDALVRYRR